MNGTEIQDEYLYAKYVNMRLYGDWCCMCEALGDRNPAGARLCLEHKELYRQEVEKIKAGKKKYPSGLSDRAKEDFVTYDELWTRLNVLWIMADNGEITKDKEKEQTAAIIRNYCKELDEKYSKKPEQKKMLPRSRSY